MSGRYIPPHKRTVLVSDRVPVNASQPSSVVPTTTSSTPDDYEFQRNMWEALKRTITGIINKVSSSNVKAVAVELFRENIWRGRGLLVRSLIRTQQADPDLSPVFAVLVAIVNKEFPDIGDLLLRRLVCLWKKVYRRKTWPAVANINRFLCQLYCFDVVDEDIVMHLILAHAMNPKRVDEDIDMAVLTFQQAYRVLLERNPKDCQTELLGPFREMLLIEDPAMQLSNRAQAVVEAMLKDVQQWQRVRLQQPAVPLELSQLAPPTTRARHSVTLEDPYEEDIELDVFRYDPEYDAHEAEYDAKRIAILGPDWEEDLLLAAEAADEAAAEQEGDDGGSASDLSKHQKVESILTQEEERSVREAVHFMIQSSVRADEVANKILRALKPGTERMVCAMVLDSCCEVATYRKLYALVAERLCKTFSTLQLMFVDVLKAKYAAADNLTERQIDHVGMFWAHLLSTDSVRWASLSCLSILTEDPSQRLIIQSLLRELKQKMGLQALHRRLLGDKELQVSLRGLFPQSDELSQLQLVVDLYESMGVGLLASATRARFEELRTARQGGVRKRERQDDE